MSLVGNSNCLCSKAATRLKAYLSDSSKGNTGEILGFISNGDLTAFGFQHGYSNISDLEQFEKSLNGIPFLPGLGNHDYQNNVNDCHRNHCVNGILGYYSYRIKDKPPVKIDEHQVNANWDLVLGSKEGHFNGNLDYSWTWNSQGQSYKFIQLNNSPDYVNQWCVSPVYRCSEINNAWNNNFLQRQLALAKANKQIVILNFHLPEGINSIENELATNDNIRLVFSGHIHSRPYEFSKMGNATQFISGNPRGGHFLMLKLGFTSTEIFQIRVSHFDNSNSPLAYPEIFVINKYGNETKITADNTKTIFSSNPDRTYPYAWRSIKKDVPYSVQNNFSKSQVIIKNVHSGLVANIYGGNMNSNSPVSIIQYPYQNGAQNETFDIKPSGAVDERGVGTFIITSSSNSNKAWDNFMSRDDIMYNHLASVEELRWYILDNDDGTYTFRNAKTKKNLDLAVCSKDYGVGLKLQSSKICGYGSSSSKWRIELATPYVQNNFSKSRVIIKNVHSGLVANIDGNMNYAPVSINQSFQYPPQHGHNQTFDIKPSGAVDERGVGTFIITSSYNSNKAWDNYMSRDYIMYNHLSTAEELRWYIIDNGNGIPIAN